MLESMLHEPWGTNSIACEAKDGDVSPTGVQRLQIDGSYADEGSRRRRRRERRDALAASPKLCRTTPLTVSGCGLECSTGT